MQPTLSSVRSAISRLRFVAIVGVVFTVGFELKLSGSLLIGDLLIVAGTFFSALYVVISRRGVEKLDPLPLAAMQQSVGLVWAIVWLVVLGHNEAAKLPGVSPSIWMLVIASGVVQYALAFWLYLLADIAGEPLNALVSNSSYLFRFERRLGRLPQGSAQDSPNKKRDVLSQVKSLTQQIIRLG